jgi:cyclophilin family peptidyl-prolyl cis-trans isomerase
VNASRPSFASVPPFTTDVARIFTATLTTSCGPIVVQLDPSASPVTTNNFVFLARQGYFDGITFHRVVGDFVVQTGDPTASGSGGPGYLFGDELPPLYPYRLGSLAMANSGPDTNGSQFFICTTARESCGLPAPSYNLFGQVISGIDVAKKIESFSSSDGSPAPTQPIYLLSVTVEETDAAPSVTTTETATTVAGVITTTTG